MPRLSLATGNGTHALSDRGPDLYETPPAAVRALLKVEAHELIGRRVWECACGPGSIVGVLREWDHEVVATDLHDWGCPDSKTGVDFLRQNHPPPGCSTIVTNPPFSLAREFVAHALELVPAVIMLCRLQFLESMVRSDVLDGGRLARVHVFRNRLPMMHRHSWDGPRASSALAFAWYVWTWPGGIGPTVLDRISWE